MVAVSRLVVGLGLVCVVVAVLVTNYVAVTIQDRSDGSRPGGGPSIADTRAIDWDAVRDPRFRRLLGGGPAIEAIKTYRELTGVGLKEAKDVVDFLREHPGLLDPPASDPPAAPPSDPPAGPLST